MEREYEESLAFLPERLRRPLGAVTREARRSIQEIRLRSGRPLSVFDGRQSRFVSRDGTLLSRPEAGTLVVDRGLLEEAFVSLCDYSVHTHQGEMGQGFITTPKGDRVGVCTSAAKAGDGTLVFRDVSSLNIRISRDIPGAARELCKRVDLLSGVVIAGAPSTGKTTILRDAGRILSSGENLSFAEMEDCKKVVFIDERYELSAMSGGVPRKNIGLCADAICGVRKKDAIEQAVRTLSPQVIVCDEMGSPEEVAEIRAGLACGVSFLVSAHCGSPEEIFQNTMIAMLMETGAFGSLVLLESPIRPATIREVLKREEFYAQIRRPAPAV